ncbi:MAG: VanZ family protein [Ignavibacteria bacterium]|nr:VanZ family protein [Ignavibacteria bacterium]
MFKYLESHRIYVVYFPLVVYWIILFVMTSLPSSMAISVGASDKIEHFGAYGLLSVFLFLALKFQSKYPFLSDYPATFTILISSLYGLIDELHQLLIPGRSAEFYDWLADFLGSVLAVVILRLLYKMYEGNKGQKKIDSTGTNR